MALQPAEPRTSVSSGRAVTPEAAAARARLEAGRDEILARHRAGAGGQEVVRSISALTDDVVQQMFTAISASTTAEAGGSGVKVALIATGGYGRGGLSPGRDGDLLALW